MSQAPAPELLNILSELAPGRALDLACGSGRHARWLIERGWEVTAVDLAIAVEIPGAHFIPADLERHDYRIESDMWDLIVCWLYWQPDLLPEIARGVREGGIVAMAGKTTGRFATSLAQFREAFAEWAEIASGEDQLRAFFIAMRLEEPID
jgi:SAM-dependent methyltransferase